MFLILLWIPAFVSVPALSQAPPPPPPQNIHVDKWLLTWVPASLESNIAYTVEYQSFYPRIWKEVPACSHKAITSCNVTSSKAESVNGCVMLRVRAERGGLSSRPVQACSRHGHSCSPEVSLTVRPQSMTIYLSRNHSLVEEHASQVKYRVYYAKAGESLTEYLDAVSSVSIPQLEEGQRYCTRVQFLYYNKPLGLESCTQCEVIPGSKPELVQPAVIGTVVFAMFLVLFIVMAYALICHRGRIKDCLQPASQMPQFLLGCHPAPQIFSSPSEERCYTLSLNPREEVGREFQQTSSSSSTCTPTAPTTQT